MPELLWTFTIVAVMGLAARAAVQRNRVAIAALPAYVRCAGCADTAPECGARAAGWDSGTHHDGEPTWLCPECQRGQAGADCAWA
jgi:hypothetical protein